MWQIILPSIGLIVFIRVVVRRSKRRTTEENKRIRENGYIALLESPENIIPTHDQRLRQAYFAVKRGQENLQHEQRLMIYDRREVEIGRLENQLTLQEVELTREKLVLEIEQKKAEVQSILNEIVYARRDLDLSTREQNLLISERKFDLLQTAFQKHMQFEKATFELARQEFFLAQKNAMRQLQEYGLLLKGKELSLEAKKQGLIIQEGMLQLRTQRKDNEYRFSMQDLLLKKDRYRNEMQRKETNLYLKIENLRNEQRAFHVERRAFDLQEEWDTIVQNGRNTLDHIAQRRRELSEAVWRLIEEKKRLEGK